MTDFIRCYIPKRRREKKTAGGLLCCNYLSGEPVVDMEEGRPLLVRRPESRLTLGNFMRAQLYSAVATLKIGMELLTEGESVKLDRLMGHGGLFKTPEAGQKIMAAAIGVPVSVMENCRRGRRVGYRAAGGIYAERRGNDTGAVHGTERLYGYANHRKGSGSRGHCRIYRLYARISGTSGC